MRPPSDPIGRAGLKLDPRQAPQRVGRSLIAELGKQRRIHQFSHHRAVSKRGETSLRSPDRLAIADGGRPEPCLVTGKDRGDSQVDRLRGEDQARSAEASDSQVQASRAGPFPRVIKASGRSTGEVKVGGNWVRAYLIGWSNKQRSIGLNTCPICRHENCPS